MSKFDRIFADKLNEEQNFPGQDQNWKNLSGMLNAHDLMTLGVTKSLRLWRAAAAVSTATVIGLGVLTYHFHTQNVLLQHTIVQQTDTYKTLSRQIDELRVERKQYAVQENTLQESRLRENTVPENSVRRLPQDAPVYRLPHAQSAAPAGQEFAHDNTAHREAESGQVDKNGAQNIENQNTTAYTTQLLEQFFKNNPEAAKVVLSAMQRSVDSLNAAKTAEPVAETPSLRVPVCAPVPAGLRAPEAVQPELPAPVAAYLGAPMVRTLHRHDRFRAGVQTEMTWAVPKQTGVSTIWGNGVTAEFSPLRNLWITASANWQHYDVSTDTVVRRFRFPDPPGPPSHQNDEELVHIDASPRLQQFALGLRYRLPIRTWVRPSVRVAHVWTHTSPGVITYRFEDKKPDPGPNPHQHEPVYLAERTDADFYGNTWKAGIGLEHETKRWVFGIYADYGKKDNLHTVTAQAGVQYRFD